MPKVRKIRVITSLAESNAAPSQQDHRGHVYRGVTLIRAGLGNRRDKNFYPGQVLRKAATDGLFEGLRAYVDHPDSVSEEIQPERTVRDLAGIYKNTRYDKASESVKADLHILRSHKWLAEAVDDLIQLDEADKIGLSINGRGITEPKRMQLQEAGEEEEVNELQRFADLRSVDFVTEAGAGGGFKALQEGSGKMHRATPSSFRGLVEAARRSKETTSMKTRAELQEALAKAKTLKEAKAIGKELTALDAAEAKQAKGTKEGFKPFKKKSDDDEDDVQENDEAEGDDADDEDPEADLDNAVEEANDDADDLADDDDDADDVEEGDGDEDEDDGSDADEDRGDRVHGNNSAAARQREAAARSRQVAKEAGIRGTFGGKLAGGGVGTPGSFHKPNRRPGKKSKLPMGSGPKMRGAREAAYDEGDESMLRENAELKAANRRLKEALHTRQTADRARKLLRESSLPARVRPHLVRDLIGMDENEMRREIARQETLFETLAGEVRESIREDFDDIEGAGSSIREAAFAGRTEDDGSSVSTLLEGAGVPMKKRG